MPRSVAYPAVLALATLCYVALGVVLPALPGHVTDDLGAGTVAVGLAWLVATRLVVGAGEGAMMAACVTWLLWLALVNVGYTAGDLVLRPGARGARDRGGAPVAVAAAAGAGGTIVAGAVASAASCTVLLAPRDRS